MPIINGTAYWASVNQPNTTFEPVYTVDVFVDAETEKTLVDEYGLSPKQVRNTKAGKVSHPGKEVGEKFFQFKRKQFRKDRTENPAPEVVDAQGNRITSLVGNGSKVRVRIKPFTWEFMGKKGNSAELTGLQVIELVTFESGDEDFDAIDGGYVATNKDKPKNKDEEFDDDIPF